MSVFRTLAIALVMVLIVIVVSVDVIVKKEKDVVNFALSSTGLLIMCVGIVYFILYLIERLMA